MKEGGVRVSYSRLILEGKELMQRLQEGNARNETQLYTI